MNKNMISQLKTIEDGMNELLTAMTSLTQKSRSMGNNYEDKWVPNCDVVIAEGKLKVIVELAGIELDSIEIEIKEQVLIIRGSRSFYLPEHNVCYYHMEIETGLFERKIGLPDIGTQFNNPKVEITDGLLNIDFDIIDGGGCEVELKI